MSERALPQEIWDQVDRISRVHCCQPAQTERCQGYHHQGTRVVYGYEVLSKAVMGAAHGARNGGIDEAILDISKLLTADGLVLKSEVLEILSGLKWPNA